MKKRIEEWGNIVVSRADITYGPGDQSDPDDSGCGCD